MADKCSRCGGKLGFMERLSGATLCSKCREEEKRLRRERLKGMGFSDEEIDDIS